jgi:hypothetical protein
MPSARTSVSNEEYEYKKEEKRPVMAHHAKDRHRAIRFGGAAGATALRHKPTIGQLAKRRQQFHL